MYKLLFIFLLSLIFNIGGTAQYNTLTLGPNASESERLRVIKDAEKQLIDKPKSRRLHWLLSSTYATIDTTKSSYYLDNGYENFPNKFCSRFNFFVTLSKDPKMKNPKTGKQFVFFVEKFLPSTYKHYVKVCSEQKSTPSKKKLICNQTDSLFMDIHHKDQYYRKMETV